MTQGIDETDKKALKRLVEDGKGSSAAHFIKKEKSAMASKKREEEND